MRVGPYMVQNIHLFNAFHLRKEGRYPEAFAEVQKGCDESDPESVYYMSRIYAIGGLGVKSNEKLQDEYFYKARDLNYPPAYHMHKFSDSFSLAKRVLCNDSYSLDGIKFAKQCVRDGHPFITEILLYNEILRQEMPIYADWGDIDALYYSTNEKHILNGANQMCVWFIEKAANICKKNNKMIESTKYSIHSSNLDYIVKQIHKTFEYDECLAMLYLYGEAMENNDEIFEIPSRIYNDTKRKVNQTIQIWLLVSKRIGFYKDITRYIAQILYNRRMFPEEWGVSLRPERKAKNKKIKK
jgi:hypothetical protein